MNLREARRARGWSQAKAATEAGVSPHLLSYAESGRFRLSVAQADRLASALGVSPHQVDELRDTLAGGTRGREREGGEVARQK